MRDFKMREEIFKLIKQYKHEIIERYDMYETPYIGDWFYYGDDFTLNVYNDEEDGCNVIIVAYGTFLDDAGKDHTDWENTIYREVISTEELENL